MDTLSNQSPNAQPTDQALLFRKYCPEGNLSDISFEDMPINVKEWLENRSRLLLHPNTVPNPLTETMVISYANGDHSYVATHRKELQNPSATEDLIYLFDERDGVKTGHAEVEMFLDGDDISRIRVPFISFISTSEGFQNEGLGKRRLVVANALSEARFGQPLHSGSLISAEIVHIWEDLVASGVAEKYVRDNQERYVFKVAN